MLAVILILSLVTAQRLAELSYGNRNARALLAKGGQEFGRGHYPLLIAVHAAWLGSLWWFAWDRPVNWTLLVIYLVLQAVRAWVLLALGSRWTSRIIVVPGEELVTSGPYRFMRHPNYAVVAGEILVLPLVFGLWLHALAFSLVNGLMLYWRIRVEDRALRSVANL